MVRKAHQPIDEHRLGKTGFVVERGADPVARFEHFAACFGVPAFIAIGQPHRAKADEQQQDGEHYEDREVQEILGERHRWQLRWVVRMAAGRGGQELPTDWAVPSAGRGSCRRISTRFLI